MSVDRPTDRPIKVAFVVEDVKAAIDFYTRVLDLEIEAIYPSDFGENHSFVFLRSRTIYVELLPSKAMDGAPVGFHHLAFWSDDVADHLEALRRRGATVLGGAYPAGVGGITLADVEGPEGILLRLFNKPA